MGIDFEKDIPVQSFRKEITQLELVTLLSNGGKTVETVP